MDNHLSDHAGTILLLVKNPSDCLNFNVSFGTNSPFFPLMINARVVTFHITAWIEKILILS